ncbi:MAG: hypothetical protein RL434_495 [Pseudomonadota bacterium]
MSGITAPARWSLGELEAVESCPLCGSRSPGLSAGQRRDDAEAFPDPWRYLECLGCRALYLSPRPDPESLGRAYGSYYTHETSSSMAATGGDRLAVGLINTYLNSRYCMQRKPTLDAARPLWWLAAPLRMKLDFMARHMPRDLCGKGLRLLDIGCGNGDFLTLAREMGFRSSGCEPDPASVALCRARGLEVVEGDAHHPSLGEGSFEVITMNHVLEHVTDQARLLARALQLLAPGGRLWLCLPNPHALGRKTLGIAWKGFHPPYHLAIPTAAWVRTALEQAGFDAIRQVKRGPQSKGLWRESFELSKREGRAISHAAQACLRLTSNLIGCLTPVWDEEQIHVAYRPGAR